MFYRGWGSFIAVCGAIYEALMKVPETQLSHDIE